MGLIYKIIEDCSPYYIRFTHDNIQNIIDLSLKYSSNEVFTKNFTHHKFDLKPALEILKYCPIKEQIVLREERVSLFVTQSGYYYRAHKDGLSNKISFNYGVKILDNKCVTSWYDDDDLKNYEIVGANWLNKSREAENFIKENHNPKKTMIAKQGECVLFNTDIFHDFDNRQSENERIVLTLRPILSDTTTFNDAKRILFEL